MDNFKKVCLPYCLRRLDDGRYLLLNRYYLPVGVSAERPNSRISQADIDLHAIKLGGIGPKTRQKIDVNGHADGEIYLYRDGCAPGGSAAATDAYLERLRTILNADS